MALSPGAREELSGILSGEGSTSGGTPQTRLRKPKSTRGEISAILNSPTEPVAPPPEGGGTQIKGVGQPLWRRYAGAFGEMGQEAVQQFVASQEAPTYGSELQKRFPWLGRYTPIPGAMDLAARAARLPASVARGGAELGPETAKPLTEQLLGGLLNLSPLLRRPAAPGARNVGELPIERQALPGPPRGVLGPSQMKPRPPGPPGQYASWRTVEPIEPLPPGSPLKALPAIGETAAPKTAMTWTDLAEKARTFDSAEAFKSYALRTPAVREQLRAATKTAEGFYKEATAPKKPPEPTPAPSSVRERMDPENRALLEQADKDAASFLRSQEAKKRPPPAPEQTTLGDLPKPEMPKTSIRKEGQSALEDSPLFGQAKAARERAAEEAQTTIPTAAKGQVRILQTPEGEPIARLRNVDAPGRGMGTWEVEEWIQGPGAKRPLPFGEGTYGDYFKGRVADKLLFSKTGEVSRSGAKHGYLQTASADLKYLAEPKAGTESAVPPSGITEIKTRPGAFQIKRGFEHGVPSLKDPDDVYSLIQRAGRLKVTEDYAGELRDVSAFFKSKNGQTIDQIAEGLADEYPALGERGAIKEQLVDTLRRYPNLKAEKRLAAGKATVHETAEQAKTTEIHLDTPPQDILVSPDEWRVLSPVERKGLVEFWRAIDEGGEASFPPKISGGSGPLPGRPTASDVMRDDSGRLDLARMAAAMKRFRQRFPMEEAVRKTMANSPAISEVERWATGLADGLQMVAKQDWWKAIRKSNPEVLKDTEEAMVRDWLGRLPVALRQRMRDPNVVLTPQEIAIQQAARRKAIATHASPELRASMAHRDIQLQRENASRAYFGLEPIPEESGPYLPRRTQAESRESVSLGGGQMGVGRGLQASVRGHGKERVFETTRQGEAGGVTYEDPRNSILLREWEGLKLRATHRLFKNLEAKGGLFRDRAAAQAASPTRTPWRVDNAPGGGTWWTPTEAEAKFLQQNLTESTRGPLGSLVGYANALTRNPNLVNPMPHFAKNMAVKALLARGPVAPYTLARDAVEWARSSNPQMLREFQEAMPFSQSGRTAGDVLGHELRNGSVSDAIRGALRTLGAVNRPSQKVIFEWADPAMRYSLFKYYRNKGMGIYEAGNHAWTDLIRYGTRSVATDFWKSIPLNFFVPWRFGTMVSLFKQATNHPIRTALLLGAIDYLREARYRATGKWTHLPQDYTEKPLASVLQERNPKDLASVVATTALFGPGGDFSAKQLNDVFNAIQNKPHAMEADRLKNAFWGISQIYNLPDEWKKGDYGGMLATALLGEHTALTYQPRRLMRDLPESLPLMHRSPLVQRAEEMQAAKHRKASDAEQHRKPRSSIEDKLRAAGYIK